MRCSDPWLLNWTCLFFHFKKIDPLHWPPWGAGTKGRFKKSPRIPELVFKNRGGVKKLKTTEEKIKKGIVGRSENRPAFLNNAEGLSEEVFRTQIPLK